MNCPKKKGFTLIELLVVMAIVGILAIVGIGNYQSSLTRGRDAKRKGDIKNVAQALDLYSADYEVYPDSDGAGRLAPCVLGGGSCTVVNWGGSTAFSDPNQASTVYMKQVPADPSSGANYYYSVSSDGKAYKLWTKLEVSTDKEVLGNPSNTNCIGYSGLVPLCGNSELCNFAKTSSNVSMCSDTGFTFSN